ncbi:O-methyltransferase domain containing protein [Amanita muscaria]
MEGDSSEPCVKRREFRGAPEICRPLPDHRHHPKKVSETFRPMTSRAARSTREILDFKVSKPTPHRKTIADLDEIFKSSAYLWETLSDPQTGKSDEPGHAAVGKVLSNGKGFWEYLAQPDQEYRQKRFDMAMRASESFFPPKIFLQAYDWQSLPNDAPVVDVGGGIGSVSMTLAKEHPNLKIIVQDQAYVVENGTKLRRTHIGLGKAQFPDALNSGRVKFEVHGFFKPQPKGSRRFPSDSRYT